MVDLKSTADFEKDLLENLKSRELDKKYLTKITSSIVNARKLGLKIIDWHMFGKPGIDGIQIHANADLKFNMSKLFELKEWRELIIFKRGTPRPDFLEIKGKFNL